MVGAGFWGGIFSYEDSKDPQQILLPVVQASRPTTKRLYAHLAFVDTRVCEYVQTYCIHTVLSVCVCVCVCVFLVAV